MNEETGSQEKPVNKIKMVMTAQSAGSTRGRRIFRGLQIGSHIEAHYCGTRRSSHQLSRTLLQVVVRHALLRSILCWYSGMPVNWLVDNAA